MSLIPVYEDDILHKGAITSLLRCARGDIAEVVDVAGRLRTSLIVYQYGVFVEVKVSYDSFIFDVFGDSLILIRKTTHPVEKRVRNIATSIHIQLSSLCKTHLISIYSSLQFTKQICWQIKNVASPWNLCSSRSPDSRRACPPCQLCTHSQDQAGGCFDHSSLEEHLLKAAKNSLFKNQSQSSKSSW